MRLIAILLTGLLVSGPAMTEEVKDFWTGNGLKRGLVASSGYKEFYQGYISGVSGTLDSLEFVCIPDEVLIDQVTAVVTKYMDEHPELLHQQSQQLIFNATRAAFPCQKKKGS